MKKAMPLRPKLDADRTVGQQLRVRVWSHDGGKYDGGRGAHASAELAWIESGSVTYRVGGQEVVVNEGMAVVIPSEVEHTTLFTGPMRGGALWLGREVLSEIGDAMGPTVRGQRLCAGLVSRSQRSLSLGRVLRLELADDDEAGQHLATESIAEAMTVEMIRTAPSARAHAGARDARVTAALDRMHSSFEEPLTVDDLARTAGMSRFHFSRLFREEVGKAPYRYLLEVRLARAAELLRRGRHSVTEAALSVGFRDFSRFSKMFRALHGCRPGDLVRSSSTRRAANVP
jgi:AraC-like DNA-binding protein